MSWIYQQSTGNLTHNGNLCDVGYSGAGEGKNNPDMDMVPYVGPIPDGLYDIGPVRIEPGPHGPYVLPLIPDAGTETYGRRGFLIHGDSIHDPGTASEGCVILNRKIREMIVASNDKKLEVIR